MLTLTHAIVAGLIAQKTGNPVTAGCLSLVSHYMLDAMPHWDFGTDLHSRPAFVTGILSIVETVISLGLVFALFWDTVPMPLLAVCIFFSVLPDWVQIPWYVVYGGKDKDRPAVQAGLVERCIFALYAFGNRFHTKAKLGLGLATQVVTILFFYVLLL